MEKTLNGAWLVLLALSAGSYLVGEDYVTGAMAVYLLMGAAFLKLVVIAGIYMELAHCRPIFLRIATGLFALTLGLIALFGVV